MYIIPLHKEVKSRVPCTLVHMGNAMGQLSFYYKRSKRNSFIFMNGINKYGHTIRMATCHVHAFPIPGALSKGENLNWLEEKASSFIRSQEIVRGASRDHGFTRTRAGIELQAIEVRGLTD